MAKHEEVSQLPLEERVRLARNEIYGMRHRLMELSKDGGDVEVGVEIYRRWDLDNEEGFEAMRQANQAGLEQAKRNLRKTQVQILKNPLATAMYIQKRLSDVLGRDEK